MFVSEIDGIVPGSLQLVLSLLEGLHNKTQLNAVLIHKARVAEIHFKNTTAKATSTTIACYLQNIRADNDSGVTHNNTTRPDLLGGP
ncbi:hypothetical protein OS493_025374 [Desmophyllum pertusum]|uniref:Uncharacterized protein n=1 Tax=Desmophyllum pertusum TaxID=174260 RepID=A0A9X0CS49_9CNID|nr:hypothetical protein OS493_025374 [Desmophyllum pertusum]